MKTIDDALRWADTFDSPHSKHRSLVMLAAEVRRLRDEVNGLTGSLERAEAWQEAVEDIASYMSVGIEGCDPVEAVARIKKASDDFVRVAVQRAERAERVLKKAQEQEQEPVAWLCGKDVTQNKDYAEWFTAFTKESTVPLYARPVPAVAVPEVSLQEWARRGFLRGYECGAMNAQQGNILEAWKELSWTVPGLSALLQATGDQK